MTVAAGLPPRPPPGYGSLPVSPAQILLPLTVSNKCGQAFRWREIELWEPIPPSSTYSSKVKAEPEDLIPSSSSKIKVEPEDHIPIPSSSCSVATKSDQVRYEKQKEWSLCLSDRVVLLRQDEPRNFIYYRTIFPSDNMPNDSQAEQETGSWLRDYLNVDIPLEDLYEEWAAKDPVFKRYAGRFAGVRMLRQDPWECLCSFICSSNNNIARIGQMVQNLCTHFSDPLLSITYPPPPMTTMERENDVRAEEVVFHYFPFPSPQRLAQPDVEDKLRNLAFGYRAKYIAQTAQMLCVAHSTPKEIESKVKDETGPRKKKRRKEGEGGVKNGIQKNESDGTVQDYLQRIRKMSYRDARNELTQFPGVGPKVADCILLMAMDQPSSIPVDRHVFQYAERWYGIRTKGGNKGYEIIADRFRDLWGEYAGWAHSVLFTADLRSFADYGKVKKEEQEPVIDEKRELFEPKQTADNVADLRKHTSLSRPEEKFEEDVNVHGEMRYDGQVNGDTSGEGKEYKETLHAFTNPSRRSGRQVTIARGEETMRKSFPGIKGNRKEKQKGK